MNIYETNSRIETKMKLCKQTLIIYSNQGRPLKQQLKQQETHSVYLRDTVNEMAFSSDSDKLQTGYQTLTQRLEDVEVSESVAAKENPRERSSFEAS